MSHEIEALIKRSIIVTGCARSGTTLVANLIHSCEKVELLFEPPLLYQLFRTTAVNEAKWRALFESYVAGEIIDLVAGRKINHRPREDTTFYEAKGLKELKSRLDGRGPRWEDARPCIKMPDILPVLSPIMTLYRQVPIVVVQRGEEDTVKSLIKKGWYAEPETTLWAYRHFGVPFWFRWDSMIVLSSDLDAYQQSRLEEWSGLTEEDRCRACWKHMDTFTWAFEAEGANIIRVQYEELVEDPHPTFHSLAEKLGLDYGPLTKVFRVRARP